jgi:hypothetical protein
MLQLNRVVTKPASYSESPGLESRPVWMLFTAVPYFLKIDHDHYLLRPTQYIIYITIFPLDAM